MTKIEKVQFVLENPVAEALAKLVSNTIQMNDVEYYSRGFYTAGEVYTTKLGETAMRSGMIMAIHNNII